MANTLDLVEEKAARYAASLDDPTSGGPELQPAASVAWFFYNLNASGEFTVKVFVPPRQATVTHLSQVSVSITEITLDGVPFMGDAAMKVWNVVPGDDQSVTVRGEVRWGERLYVRLNMIIVN